MLAEANRLKKENDFKRVFKKGEGCRQGFLFLKAVKNNLKHSRFGFIVSNRFSKKAVVRNRIKRRLRELVKKNMPQKGLDIVITVMPGFKLDELLGEEIIKLFKKARIIK